MSVLAVETWKRSEAHQQDGAEVTLQHMRSSLERRVEGMPLPRQLTLANLCESLSEHRSRPLHLLPMALPADGPCGLWVATGKADYVVFEASTSSTHRTHIILHEIAHVLLEHTATRVLTDDATHLLMPHLDLETVERLMARTWYDERAEQEAEMCASILSRRISQAIFPPSDAAPAEVSAVVERLRRSLERTH